MNDYRVKALAFSIGLCLKKLFTYDCGYIFNSKPKYGILSSKTYKRDSHINTTLKMNNTDLRTFARLRPNCARPTNAQTAVVISYILLLLLLLLYKNTLQTR